MVYDQRNVVGTVSQSGGVPTGALIERGSNTNGEYTRLADGTQVCTRLLTESVALDISSNGGFRSAGTALTWAVAFAGKPACAVSTESGAVSAFTNSVTSSGFTLMWWAGATSAAAPRSDSLIVIGRWL